jgi:HD-like signal output (HDOD) protein
MALHEVENLSVGITHADVGAELLRHWGLPVDVTEPVRSHHDLTPPKAAKLTVGQAVVAARLLLGAQGGLNDPADPLAPSDLEPWQPVFDQLPPAAQQLMTAIAEHGDSRETAGV